jgi:hypothetical protein
MENWFFGLTLTELRGLAFDLPERNKISNNFNKSKRKKDGRFYAFLNSFPQP